MSTIAWYPQEELTKRYRAARLAWRGNSSVREVASLLGLSERNYCGQYIGMFPPIYRTSSTAVLPEPLDYDKAFVEATP